MHGEKEKEREREREKKVVAKFTKRTPNRALVDEGRGAVVVRDVNGGGVLWGVWDALRGSFPCAVHGEREREKR